MKKEGRLLALILIFLVPGGVVVWPHGGQLSPFSEAEKAAPDLRPQYRVDLLLSELGAAYATNLVVPAATGGISGLVGMILYPFIFLPLGMSFGEAMYHFVHLPSFMALAGVSPIISYLGVVMVAEANNLKVHWSGLLFSYAAAGIGTSVALAGSQEWGARLLLLLPPLGALAGANLRLRYIDPDLPSSGLEARRRDSIGGTLFYASAGAALGGLTYYTSRTVQYFCGAEAFSAGGFEESIVRGRPLDWLMAIPLASSIGAYSMYSMRGRQTSLPAVSLGSLLGSLGGWGVTVLMGETAVLPAVIGSAAGAVAGALVDQLLLASRAGSRASPTVSLGISPDGALTLGIDVRVPP